MDLTTLFIVYAGILAAVACSLIITWRQNPAEVGPRTWAIGSGLAALAKGLRASEYPLGDSGSHGSRLVLQPA